MVLASLFTAVCGLSSLNSTVLYEASSFVDLSRTHAYYEVDYTGLASHGLYVLNGCLREIAILRPGSICVAFMGWLSTVTTTVYPKPTHPHLDLFEAYSDAAAVVIYRDAAKSTYDAMRLFVALGVERMRLVRVGEEARLVAAWMEHDRSPGVFRFSRDVWDTLLQVSTIIVYDFPVLLPAAVLVSIVLCTCLPHVC